MNTEILEQSGMFVAFFVGLAIRSGGYPLRKKPWPNSALP
jgi:hypothetical protein